MKGRDAIEELAREVRMDAAMVRARERLVSRLEAFAAQLRQIGFTRVTVARDPTGMLLLSIDPEVISVSMPNDSELSPRQTEPQCPVCVPHLTEGEQP